MTEGISLDTSSLNINMGQDALTQSVVGKDEFLKLLTFQLRSQNPLKPYDNQEFAAQLAQFSQLEQLVDIRSMLEEQIYVNNQLTQTIANSALPGMIGKQAKAYTDNFNFNGFDNPTLGYDLDTNVQSGTLTIKNSAGKVIKTIELSGDDLKQGSHKIEWDGTDNNGNSVGADKFYFSVEGDELDGGKFMSYTSFYGKIEAVRFKSEGTMLVINGTEMALNTIADIAGG